MTTSPDAPAAAARTPFVSKAPKLGLVGSFDGIRGIGVMMVLIGHALAKYVESWSTIVDSFFVLSGFLITTLLIQESRSTGRIDLRRFYARRAIRLLPTVWLFCGVWLVLAAVGSLLGIEGLVFTEVLKDALAAVTYVYHVVFPNGLYLIDPDAQNVRTMWHLWTLSVEEHFYLIIPGMTLLFVRWNRIRELGILMAVGALAVGVARWQGITGFMMEADTLPGVRLAFLQRPDALMFGVLVAVINAHLDDAALARVRRVIVAAGSVGLVVWFAMLNLSSGLVQRLGGPYFDYLPTRDGLRELGFAEVTREAMTHEAYWFRFGHSLGAAGFAAVVLCLARVPDWWVARAWSWHPLQWLGRMSYTLYVWHAMPYLIIMALTGGEEASLGVQLARVPVMVALAFAISLPVFHKVEQPLLGVKLRFASEKDAVDLRVGKRKDRP